MYTFRYTNATGGLPRSEHFPKDNCPLSATPAIDMLCLLLACRWEAEMRSALKFGKVAAVIIGVAGGLSSLPAMADEAFNAFWTEFTTALTNDDVETVRNLVKFPVMYNGEELGADSFPTLYDGWFDADARDCLATTTPVEDGVDYYVAYCELIYVFVNSEDGWRFEGVSVND
jgi:hypothetical protein